MRNRLYAQRDHMAQGEHYVRHVDHMTSESLFDKSAIAGELAHRDIEIESLRARVVELEAERDRYMLASADHQIGYEAAQSQLTTLRAGIQAILDDQRLYSTVTVERVRLEELLAATGATK